VNRVHVVDATSYDIDVNRALIAIAEVDGSHESR
jgi:hypothetical protein